MRVTYEIEFKQMAELYQANEEFRDVIRTGGFVHCENHLVINHPMYIDRSGEGVKLTEYARAHKEECCLVFHYDEE